MNNDKHTTRHQARGTRHKAPSTVMATGVFDILHPGHIYYLTEAKKLGDYLIVVIARDATVRKLKGHDPIVPDILRLQIVQALKPVDKAVLGNVNSHFDILDEIRPDIIALGYDQIHDEQVLIEECKKRKLKTKIVRLNELAHDLLATRRIVKKIVELYGEKGE